MRIFLNYTCILAIWEDCLYKTALPFTEKPEGSAVEIRAEDPIEQRMLAIILVNSVQTHKWANVII